MLACDDAFESCTITVTWQRGQDETSISIRDKSTAPEIQVQPSLIGVATSYLLTEMTRYSQGNHTTKKEGGAPGQRYV